MRHINKIYVSLFCILLLYTVCSNAFGLDKYYLLKKGNKACEENKEYLAVRYYEQYINYHPTSQGIQAEAYCRKRQYYIRNLLIAYSNLLQLYQKMDKPARLRHWLRKLHGTYKSAFFGSKNSYKLALIYLDYDLEKQAIEIMQSIIQNQINDHIAYNNKVTLRAYAKLFKIYSSQGKEQKKKKLIKSLTANFPTPDFDLHDRYKLANLFLKQGMPDRAQSLFTEITNKNMGPESSELTVQIKAYTKLMKLYHRRKNQVLLQEVSKEVSQKYLLQSLSPYNSYKLAITFLACDQERKGAELLKSISKYHPYSHYARRSLFLLGRLAQSREDWDSAIKHYSQYISRYPDNPFFTMKAYMRMVDSYWCKDGQIKTLQNKISLITDIINGVAGYRTKLNLARDLKRKGMEELASSTFDLGLEAAKRVILEKSGTYKELRAYWLIQKYAYAMGEYGLVQKYANHAFRAADNLKSKPLSREKEKKIDYVLSQTHLWLARAHKEKGLLDESEDFLKSFIQKYPEHREINYARYELGKVYESRGRIKKALHMYHQVDESMWEPMARKRLKSLEGNAN